MSADEAGGELRAHWRVVLAAGIGSGAGITGMSIYSLSILINPLCDAFGWSRAEVSAAKTILTASFVLAAPIIGYLADRVGVRLIALWSLPLFALAMLAMTQVGPGIGSFYLSLTVLGLTGCGTTPLVWTRAVATWFQQRRGLALALTLIGPGVMAVVTPLLLETLILRFDWRAAYVTMAAFAALTLIPVGLFFRENRGQPSRPLAVPALQAGLSVAEAVRSPRFWQFVFGFTLIGAVVSSLTVHLIPLVTDVGLRRAVAVQIAGVLGIAIICGRLITGYLVDRLHPPYVAAAFLSMPILGCLILISGSVSTALAVLAVICVGLAAGSEVDLVPYLTARYFGLKSFGKIYGWVFVAFYAGVGVGPLWLGHMYDVYGSYARAITLVIPILAIGVVAIAALGRAPPVSTEHSLGPRKS
jgi:MFS family permease